MRRTLVSGSLAAGLLIALLGGVAPAGGADSAFRVDKLILTTFDGEQGTVPSTPPLGSDVPGRRWGVRPHPLPHRRPCLCGHDRHHQIKGRPLNHGAAARPTVATRPPVAVRRGRHRRDPQPGRDAGDAGLADWVVDVDLGTHLVDRRQAPPYGWLPFDDYDQAAYRLNAELVSQAYQATRQLTLDDDQTAEAERAYYGPAEVAETPRVQRCDTAGSDGFWVGADWADKADHILRKRITAVDPATAVTAAPASSKRLGLLDRLLVVRTASDFEDQRPGTSPRALYDLLRSPAGFAGYNISRENAYRVAWQLAHTL